MSDHITQENQKNLTDSLYRVWILSNERDKPTSPQLAAMVAELGIALGLDGRTMQLLLDVSPQTVKGWLERPAKVSFQTSRLIWVLWVIFVQKRPDAVTTPQIFANWGESMPQFNWRLFEKHVEEYEQKAVEGVRCTLSVIAEHTGSTPEAALRIVEAAGYWDMVISEKSDFPVDAEKAAP